MDLVIRNADREKLLGVRGALETYDMVAIGINTLTRRLQSIDDTRYQALINRLRDAERRFTLHREPFWLIQVADTTLCALVRNLESNFPGADLPARLAGAVSQLQSILISLTYELEKLPRRPTSLTELDPAEAGRNNSIGNLDLLAYEMAFGRSHLSSHPLRHVLDTTSRCNLRCVTCHQSILQEMVHYDLADVRYSALIPAFFNARQLFLAGMGEPLLSRSIFELAAAAKASGAYVEAVTNGTTLARGARLFPALDMLFVSFDGGTRESYNAIRRNGSFDKLVDDIRKLHERDRKKICFNVVVCKQNIFTMESLVDLAVDLQIGHIHLQEMNGYLAWHDLMIIDDLERGWLFDSLPAWTEKAQAAGISLMCNLVPGELVRALSAAEMSKTTTDSLAAVADAPLAKLPRRRSITEISDELEALLAAEPDPILAAVSEFVEAVAATELDQADQPADAGGPDWEELREFVASGQAMFPHCLSTYAHLVVNGDGTTRSCCKVQNRLADVDADSFADIWNAPAYVALRSAHAAQMAPREACSDCRDPVRFHYMIEILEALAAHDIDISMIRKPADFPVPASSASHPLVVRLGANVG